MAEYYKNTTGGYSINYDDQKFQDIKAEQTKKESNLSQNYDNMINNTDKYYQAQIEATKDYSNQQTELQKAQLDQQKAEINQQKDKAQSDYTKEQMGSYADYMKQTKSNAQDMANSGLSNTGYSESSLVSMYNQYQTRVATAKESLNTTMVNFSNQINQATIANNQSLAEIAFNALQTQNQLNQQAFEYKNNLILDKEKTLQSLNDMYYQRNQDLINNINTEIELQVKLDEIDRQYEQWITQFNEQKRQWQTEFDARNAQWEKEYALKEKEASASIAQSNAQASYYRAQASSLSSEQQPYKNTVNATPKQIKAAEDIRNELVKVAKKMGTPESKSKAKQTFAQGLSNAFKAGKITDEQMQSITKEVFSHLN